MHDSQHFWQKWAGFLHHWGAREVAASFLEAFGPLSVLGAQLVYLGQPLFKRVAPNDQLMALASMLENRSETEAFINLLREEALN